MSESGWHAHAQYEFITMSHRLHLWRKVSSGETEEIVGFDEEGMPKTHLRTAGIISGFPGFMLPDDLTAVIGEAINPGPSRAELDVYKTWLDVERARVDEYLMRVTPIT